MNSSTPEMDSSVPQMTSSVKQMKRSVQQMTSSAEEMNSSVQKMDRSILHMNSSVQQFTVLYSRWTDLCCRCTVLYSTDLSVLQMKCGLTLSYQTLATFSPADCTSRSDSSDRSDSADSFLLLLGSCWLLHTVILCRDKVTFGSQLLTHQKTRADCCPTAKDPCGSQHLE